MNVIKSLNELNVTVGKRIVLAFQNVSDDRCLDGRDPGMTDAGLTNRPPANDPHLHWQLIPTASGKFLIQSISGHGYLNIMYGEDYNLKLLNGPIDQGHVESWNDQWHFDLLQEGIWVIRSPYGIISGRKDVPSFSHEQPADNKFLQWKILYMFAPAPAAHYAIQSVSSGGCLDGRDPGMNDPCLTYRPPANDVYLQWLISSSTDGFSIRSVSGHGYLVGNSGGSLFLLNSWLPRDHWDIALTPEGNWSIKSVTTGGFLDGRDVGMSQPVVTFRNPAGDKYLQWRIIDN